MLHKPLCLDEFRLELLDPAKGVFEGTYKGPLHHYLGCAITCDDTGTRTMECHANKDAHDTRLTVDNCPDGYVDPHIHAQYQGVIGSLGWIVGMTRPN